jgi:hypothetical protein
MIKSRGVRGTIAVVVIACFFLTGCAQTMGQSPGQTALLCGAGGAAAGAAIGGAVGRNWQSALIGAAAGALAAGLSCFAFAEYKSRQVRDYGQTQQATGYQPTQGDRIQITHYEIAPAAAAPGSSVAFNATYTVMTPNPDADVTVTEVRSLYVQDPQTNNWRELGRVPNPVTVKAGTRQADGKFDVRSGVAEGNYQIVFQVVKDEANDRKSLPLIVTSNQAILGSPQARVAQVSTPGAKPLEVAGQARSAVTAPAVGARSAAAPAPEPLAGANAPTATGAPLSSLGELDPKAPARLAAAPPPAAKRIAYFVASKVSGRGTLRAGPGSSYAVVGSIGEGERYPIVNAVRQPESSWFKIRIDTGGEAWVAGALGHEVEE